MAELVPKPVGRPTKLSPALSEAIAEAIKFGWHKGQAAIAAGITRQTFYNWYNAGEELRHKVDDNPDLYEKLNENERLFLDFFDRVELALVEVEGYFIGKLHEAVRGGDVSTAKWYLERAFPQRWGRADRLEVAGDPDKPIMVELLWPEQARPA